MNVMHTSTRALVCALATGLGASLSVTAVAEVIDLRNLPRNFDQCFWGQSDTTLYAQSLVPEVTGFFEEFRFRVRRRAERPFSILITGARPDEPSRPGFARGLGLAPDLADIRYDSGRLVVPEGQGEIVEMTVFPDARIRAGEAIFVVLNAFSYPEGGQTCVRATEFDGVDRYPPGEFVYINTLRLGIEELEEVNGFNWNHFNASRNEDLAIYARLVEHCPADLDGDGEVGIADLLAVLAAWGNTGGPEDLDGNGVVDIGDLLIVLANWGPCAQGRPGLRLPPVL